MRHESLFFLFSGVTRIKGIGGTTAKALERLLPPATALSGSAAPIMRDLLFHLPVSIVDRRFTCPLYEAPAGKVCTFVVTVGEHQPPPRKRGSKKPYKVICSNESGDITLVFFHADEDYLKQALPVGSRRVISGQAEHFDFRLQMTHPDIIAPADRLAEVQKVEAVYPLTVGLTSRRIAKFVGAAMEKLPVLPEWIAQEWMTHQRWPSWKDALTLAHHPENEADLQPGAPARLRLAYDEILANQLHLALIRRRMQQQEGTVIPGAGALTKDLLATLPFQLTNGQQQALKEIMADMQSGRRMGRLLQGDVGSGKTIVALFAMLRVVEHGYQAALMAPTEILARQHCERLAQFLAALPHPPNIILLTGSIKGKQREKALADIASGAAGIVIGTHALFQDEVTFGRLALAVIDEQHRFGVGQRMALTAKGDAPHLLHMTATPIPRSLTMTLYGDMDCSLLKDKPPGRLPVTTRVVSSLRYSEVMERLKTALEKGEKAYWICPLIEGKPPESELDLTPENDIAAAQARAAEFRARFGDIVGLAHGRMKPEARDGEMRRFAAGETRLLVATTVVEVGVDIRDATIMVIEKAERFGLSQLHQLRGRIGRGDKPSACVLLYGDQAGEAARIRLLTLRDSEDGFHIAEADLALRGGGDLLGARQSGLPRFIFMNLLEHQELLAHARSDIGQYLDADPDLSSERGQALEILLQLFELETTSLCGYC